MVIRESSIRYDTLFYHTIMNMITIRTMNSVISIERHIQLDIEIFMAFRTIKFLFNVGHFLTPFQKLIWNK